MEKIENRLIEFWKELRKKTIITIEDFDALERELENRCEKLQRQRDRLEQSRDMWKNKFMKLKEEVQK